MEHELVYTSCATREMNKKDLTELLEVSRDKNARLNITGLLVYHNREFIQLLEGAKKDIFDLYDTICEDERNTQNQLLWDGEIKQRSFTDWAMAFVDTRDIDTSELEAYSPFLKEGITSLNLTGSKSMGRRMLLAMRDKFLG